jgi:hypothetical protein
MGKNELFYSRLSTEYRTSATILLIFTPGAIFGCYFSVFDVYFLSFLIYRVQSFDRSDSMLSRLANVVQPGSIQYYAGRCNPSTY